MYMYIRREREPYTFIILYTNGRRRVCVVCPLSLTGAGERERKSSGGAMYELSQVGTKSAAVTLFIMGGGRGKFSPIFMMFHCIYCRA